MARKPASAGHMKKGPSTKDARANMKRPDSTLGGKTNPIRKALVKAYGKHK